MNAEILKIPSHKIDCSKWNDCISRSANGLIYATTDYLDHIADNWTGIVVNDYDIVMPVVWRKKYGISYAYDVPFIQQLGIFSTKAAIPYDKLMEVLFSACKYGDYNFNFGNNIAGTTICSNFILPLGSTYENIEKKFSIDTRQNIRRSYEYDLSCVKGSIDEAVDIYQQTYGSRLMHVTSRQFENFKSICRLLQNRDGGVIVRKVVNSSDAILAIVLLLKDNRRLYNLMNSVLPEGRPVEANYFLLSNIWTEFQGSDYLFDFEGSDLPGVKKFYQKFGAVNQPYYRMHFNHLPWLLKLVKR